MRSTTSWWMGILCLYYACGSEMDMGEKNEMEGDRKNA